jgi:glycosyltransferase involved in cell wall biosynthesis
MVIVQLTTDNRWQFQEYHKPVPWFGPAPEALLQGFAGLAGLEVHVVSCTQKPMMASPEKLADNIWFHSLHVPTIGWLRTGYQGCIRAVRKKLKEIQPDIVHGTGTERDCSISAIFSGFPNVITIHGNMADLARIARARIGSFHWLTARLEDFTLPRTAGVLCNSVYTENLVRPRARKIWRIPHALRQAFFVPANAASLPKPPACVLLNVGTVLPLKHQNELLDVAEQLHAEGLSFELHFAGTASAKDPYAARFLGRFKNRPHLFWDGYKSIDEIIAQYDRSTALVHVSAAESFGLVVAEALSRNLKFFGFNSGGVLDIATGVEGAELFEYGDWPGLKSSIARWIRSGFPRPETAARVMRERYYPDEIARRHMEVFREVLNLH